MTLVRKLLTQVFFNLTLVRKPLTQVGSLMTLVRKLLTQVFFNLTLVRILVTRVNTLPTLLIANAPELNTYLRISPFTQPKVLCSSLLYKKH